MTDKQIGGQQMRDLAQIIDSKIKGLGFALIVFPFYATENSPAISNYISNAKREDMIKALEETLARWKNNEDFTTPETN